MAVVEFSSKTATYSEFSNFYPSPFLMGVTMWPTVEHYFQAQKFPGHTNLQKAILRAATPDDAKKLGKIKSSYFRLDWDEVKEMIMLEAIQAKFEQNEDLAILLKSTGTALLKESTSWKSGRNGKNRIGELLMIVRQGL